MTEVTNSDPTLNGESFDAEAWINEFEAVGGSVFYGGGQWHFGWKEFGNDHRDRAAELCRALTCEQKAAVRAHRDASPVLDDDTLRIVAEAWINRWCALGGSFGRILNADGSPQSACRGIPMSYTWNPPTWEVAEAMTPALRPHEQIVERKHFDGAHRMLESLLTLIPGLAGTVQAIGHEVIEIAGGHATPEMTISILKSLAASKVAEGQVS